MLVVKLMERTKLMVDCLYPGSFTLASSHRKERMNSFYFTHPFLYTVVDNKYCLNESTRVYSLISTIETDLQV